MAELPVNAVEVHHLVKRFDGRAAVDGLDLTIRRGELVGFLGPNGAGKSTTLRILSTLMPATEGSVVVAGCRVPEENDRLKPLLGLVPQEVALYDNLTIRQNLRFFGRIYGISGGVLERRIVELLEGVGLADRADSRIHTLSGGMQRRVNIAAALVHDPAIVFLDEPTVGLDPVSRNAIWKVLDGLKARGKTMVLTTHYMEEAEALSDRVAVIDHGKVIAYGTTAELIRATGTRTVLHVAVAGEPAAAVDLLRALPDVKDVRIADGQLHVQTESGGRLLPALVQALVSNGIEVRGVEVVPPNLGTVFLHYAGRELRD